MTICRAFRWRLQWRSSSMATSHRYSYRFLFAPATIGPIVWLAQNEAQTARIRHGLILACVGDPGNMTYKKSRRGDAEVDRAVAHVLKHSGAGIPNQRFFSLGIRRKAVLLSRLQSSRGLPDEDSERLFPGVPQFGGQSGICARRESGRFVPQVRVDPGSSGKQLHLSEPESKMRTAVGQARTVSEPWAARPTPPAMSWRCFGC